ncbi:DUF262 domain-containing protein [Helicobacter pylori]|nr:DUF262 domain-containing protein [Helicobacter pylori]
MAEMEPDKKSLKKILVVGNDTYYQIPIYQRPYQWGEEQCKELLNDLFENYEDHRKDDYFCGSLVFIQPDKDNKTDIVDGQQRLSTFILLAKVLATLYSERLDPMIQEYLQESWSDRHEDGKKKKRERLYFDLVGSNAKKDFQEALDFFDDLDASKGEDSKSNDPSKGKNSYLKNAVCLKNYLEKKKIADINDFIRWLYLKVIFIKTTCSNISMALRIFSVLNARGLPLHAIDVFKVELLKKLAKGKDQEEFVSRWNALRQKCSENESKFPKRKENKREKNAAEILFSWYLTYLHPVTSGKNMEERLADQFERLNKTPLEYLILVEYFMSDDPEPKRIQTNDFHVEHILPQKPTLSSQWANDFSEEERERYTHSLANLTLLGGNKNSQASNLDFKEKKEIYMGKPGLDNKETFKVMTCYKMTIDIAHHYTEWTPKSLEKREKDLMSIIESVLTL